MGFEVESLAVGDVHAWVGALDEGPDSTHEAAALLSPDELDRAARFRVERHRGRYIACRAGLRRLVAAYLGQEPAALRFAATPLGKPFLRGQEGGSGLRFSLSHSEGLAVFALTVGREVGIDVEARRPVPDADAVARRFFSPLEVSTLQSLPSDQRAEAFLTCWTRKEAFLKAGGRGLSFPLDRLCVTVAPNEAPRIIAVEGEPEAAREWVLADLDVGAAYVASLAIWKGMDRLVCRLLPTVSDPAWES